MSLSLLLPIPGNRSSHKPSGTFAVSFLSGMVGVIGGGLLWLPAALAQPLNPEIEVGIVQRFGEDPAETLTLKALPGDQLTLTFTTHGQPETVTATEVKLEIVAEALPKPELQERVVLSTHRSFESAEDSANQWRERGIEPEIAQPGTWEVWAHRDIYNTPLIRRLLLKNLEEQGFSDPYLDTEVLSQAPKAAFIANGYRYHRDIVDISSANRRIWVTRNNETEASRLYGGDLRLQPNTYGTYTLVNDVPIETYLRGVVPYEIGPGAPPTTIEAQAILARTYALRNLRRFAIDDYELCADTQCQVYRGLSGAADVTDRAILTTQGQVLTYENELVDALYSSTTGGVTAPFSEVWNGPDRPYLRSVVDSVQGSWDLAARPLNDEQNLRSFIGLKTGFNEDDWDLFRWQFDSPLTEVTQDLKTYLQKKKHPLENFTQIQAIRVLERGISGRVQRLEIQTDLGPVRLEKDEIIRVLSAPRSLLFYVEPIQSVAPTTPEKSPDAPDLAPQLTGFRFVGGGWGHGVGLSQTGAYRLGDLGWSSPQILQFYYPGTQLQPINKNLVYWQDPVTSAASDQ